MRAYWEGRDPIALYEKFLIGEKACSTAKSKKDVDEKTRSCSQQSGSLQRIFAVPPPEFAETGVYCTGDDCHKIRPNGRAAGGSDAAEIGRQACVGPWRDLGPGKAPPRNAAISLREIPKATFGDGTPGTARDDEGNGSKAAPKLPGKTPAKSAAISSAT